MNTERIDVLSAMDAARVCVSCYPESDPMGSKALRFDVPAALAKHDEARAAIAELIEAAARVNAGHTAPHDCYATGPLTGNPIADLVACPGCALAHALARVQGDHAAPTSATNAGVP